MHTQYYLIKNKDNGLIVNLLKKQFSVKEQRSSTVRQNYYDTFDLRLQKEGCLFYKSNTNYVLQNIDDGNDGKPVTFKSTRQLKFWQDFPTSELRDRFKNMLDVRTLIMFASIKNDIQFLNIVDSEDKIVAKISLENIYLDQSSFWGKILTLTPIKGYNKYYNKLIGIFSAQDFIQPLTQKDFINSIIEDSGRIPIDYTTKPAVIDNPQMLSGEAVIKLLRSLTAIFKANEGGIIGNIDTEFLHDFRVALRRTRSLLTQLKDVFNQEEIARYKAELTSLAVSTNRLRDYDVYLLNKDNYQRMLPMHLHKGLNQFFIAIKKRKKYEHGKFVKKIKSSSYREFIDSWEQFLGNSSKLLDNINSNIPIIEPARKHIYNRFKKILKKGKKIDKLTPDVELHSLRIECKKLRYLIEFFSGLFPHDDIITLITQLKKLQTCLGDFNDYSIQQIHLEEYLSTIKKIKTDISVQYAAIGALIAASYQEKMKKHDAFFKIFKKFANKENIDIYKKLFKTN